MVKHKTSHVKMVADFSKVTNVVTDLLKDMCGIENAGESRYVVCGALCNIGFYALLRFT